MSKSRGAEKGDLGNGSSSVAREPGPGSFERSALSESGPGNHRRPEPFAARPARLLTTREVAALVNARTETVIRHVKRGSLRSEGRPAGTYLFEEAEVRRWVGQWKDGPGFVPLVRGSPEEAKSIIERTKRRW